MLWNQDSASLPPSSSTTPLHSHRHNAASMRMKNKLSGSRVLYLPFMRWIHVFNFKTLPFINMSLVEVGLVLMWLCFNVVVFFWQYYFNFNEFPESWPLILIRLARTLGHINNLNLGLVLLPVARNSLWLPLLGLSFERAIRLHRWTARFFFLSITTHLCLWWIFWIDQDVYDEQIRYGLNDQTTAASLFSSTTMFFIKIRRPVVILGHIAWLIAFVMVVMAYEWFRRKTFEMFYYTHHLFIVLIGVALAHNFTGVNNTYKWDLLIYWLTPGRPY